LTVRRFSLKGLSRRDFLKAVGYGTIASSVLPGLSFSNQSIDKSEIFHVTNIPVSVFTESNHHVGVDALINLMGENGSKFYKSNLSGLICGPEGFINKDDVVVIKVNGQWKYRGSSNSDVLRGIIQSILEHPDGFAGEIIVVENGQSQGSLDGRGLGWGSYQNIDVHANAEDESHSFNYVVQEVFRGKSVSSLLMDSMRKNYVSDDDHTNNGYRKIGNVSYPCFTTRNGNRVELAKGIWKDGAYHDNLKLINLPVLKTHHGSGITASLKHTYGILTTDYQPINYHYSDIGKAVGSMFAALPPTLNIIDAIWISPYALSGYPESATRRVNHLAASFDPVALDFYSGKYIMYPVSNDANHHPEMTDQYTDSNLSTCLKDAADIINGNGGVWGKLVTNLESNMTPFEFATQIQAQINLNKIELVPGDELKLSYRITNPRVARAVDFYLAIKIGLNYYFYPDWTTALKASPMTLPGNSNPAFTDIITLPITSGTPSGEYMFAAAVAESETTNIFGFIDYKSFRINSGAIAQSRILESLRG
jgi:hypothetical protein